MKNYFVIVHNVNLVLILFLQPVSKNRVNSASLRVINS